MSVPTATLTKTTNPVRELSKYGQSAWLDYIRRSLISSGELKRLIEEDGLGGVTSNPAIFEKAITGSTDYTDALLELQKRKDLDAMGVYEILAIKDIQDAADTLRRFTIAPKCAMVTSAWKFRLSWPKDTQGTIKDARRLWKAVNRPNLMVKIPATVEGIPAIQQCISEGININVTLLFAQEMYEKVAQGYIAGLKTYAASGGDPQHVASVASFFISRIDSMVDSILKARLKTSTDPKEQALLKSLMGKVAIANAKLTYQRYKEIYAGPEWAPLADKERADPAPVVGQHQHQGSQLLGRHVCRRADRSRHGGHHSARHLRCVPRSWQAQGQPGGRPRCRPRHHGNARKSRHLDEESHRRSGDASREAVRRTVRQTAEHRGRQVQVCVAGRSGLPDLQLAGGNQRAISGSHRGLENGRQGAPAVGARRVAVDRLGRRQLAGMARHHRGSTRQPETFRGCRRRREGCRFQACAAARNGRIQPVSGSSADDVRQDRRVPGVVRAGFHRSRPGESFREQGRHRQYDFHRFEQVRLNAGAEHLQAIFLRARETGGGRG